MSEKIDLSKELTEEEVAYFEARGVSGRMQLEQNRRQLAIKNRQKSGDVGTMSDDEDEGPQTPEEKAKMLSDATTWIQRAKLDELRDKAEEWDLDTSGTKDELKARLLEAVNKEYGPDED